MMAGYEAVPEPVGAHLQVGMKGMRACCGDFRYMDMKWRIRMVDGRRSFLWVCPMCGAVVCVEGLEQVGVA